jgi:hypothetical protein
MVSSDPTDKDRVSSDAGHAGATVAEAPRGFEPDPREPLFVPPADVPLSHEPAQQVERDPNERTGLEHMATEFGGAEATASPAAPPPLAEYEKLRIPEILVRCESLAPDQVRAICDFERQHRNRKSLLTQLERRLRGPKKPRRSRTPAAATSPESPEPAGNATPVDATTTTEEARPNESL